MNKIHTQINFHFLIAITLNRRSDLKAFIASQFKKNNMKAERLDVIFCDDGYLLTLNRQFLQHDFYTDILSFPLSSRNQPLIAEIYISVDRVRDNAINLETSFKEEIHRVIFHGVLHFCGFRDKTQKEKRLMHEMENKWIKTYFR